MTTMTKTDLVKCAIAAVPLAVSDGEAILEAFISCIVGGLKAGSEVRVHGLGTLSVVQRNARKGRNPKTGDAVDIAAKKVVKLKVSSVVTDVINAPAPAPGAKRSK